MHRIINEFTFRLGYVFICYVCLSSLHYLSSGWQLDYFLGLFANQYENSDYCFNESLAWESQYQCSNHTVTALWSNVYYANVIYFYSLELKNNLSIVQVYIYQINIILWQVYAFSHSGSFNRLFWLSLFYCFALLWFFISGSLWLFFLLEELALEPLDSELQIQKFF